MGLFKKRATDPAEIERLRAEIAAMGARLSASDAAKHELDTTVRGLATRLETATPPPPISPPPATPPPGAPGGPDDERIERLDAEVERLSSRLADDAGSAVDPARLDDLAAQMQRIGERIDTLDARITAISTELANQITELSADIDGVDGQPPAESVVTELRDAQVRLAGEQARYQIAFRQDLADLADRLRRT